MSSKRYITIISIGINLIFVGFIVLKWLKQPTNLDNSDNQNAYWMDRDQYFETLPIDSSSVVFLGTSLTQNFEIHEHFKMKNLHNRGIIGDNILGMINRLDAITSKNPSKILIEAGINDLGDLRLVPAEVVSNYQTLLRRISEKSPTSKIYIQTILPVENECEGMKNYCSVSMNEKIIETNELLKDLIKEFENVKLIDAHSAFVKNKNLAPEYSIDGVHLSAEGYQNWAEVLRTFLKN